MAEMKWLRGTIVIGIPALVALAAALAFPFWTLGIPGDATAEYARGWWLGYLVIGLYPGVYVGWLGIWVVVLLMRWPGSAFLHTVIWSCLIAFLTAMAVSVYQLIGT